MIWRFAIDLSWMMLTLQCVRGFIELINLKRSLLWVQSGYSNLLKNGGEDGSSNPPFFFILIPVLREQKVLKETLENFSAIDYPHDRFKIVIITTEKEIHERDAIRGKIPAAALDLSRGIKTDVFVKRYLGLFDGLKLKEIWVKAVNKNIESASTILLDAFDKYPTTIDLTNDLVRRINHGGGFKAEIIHYPHTFGVMAHQVNFAVKEISRREGNENYIGLYNADSDPDPKTLMAVAEVIKNNGGNAIIQQSAIFTRNFDGLPMIFKSGGLFQSQWTFSHEIPRISAQLKSVCAVTKSNEVGKFFKARLTHCVGHGMFIKISLFEKLGLFPEETMNEDLPFGFKACVKNIPIIPLCALESADTPASLKFLINQKKVWFWSYLDYLKCRRICLQSKSNSKALINSLTIQGLWNGFIWFMGSTLFLIPLIVAIVSADIYLFLAIIIALVIFHFYPAIVILTRINNLNQLPEHKRIKIIFFDYFVLPFLGLAVLFTDSVGPWLAVLEKFVTLFTKAVPYKQKTER